MPSAKIVNCYDRDKEAVKVIMTFRNTEFPFRYKWKHDNISWGGEEGRRQEENKLKQRCKATHAVGKSKNSQFHVPF